MAGDGGRTVVLLHGYPRTGWSRRRRCRGEAMWYFFFHNAEDGLAEALTVGRERLYLEISSTGSRFMRPRSGTPISIDTGRLHGDTASFFAPMAGEMLGEVAAAVATATIPRAGHWIAEENPGAVVEHLLAFFGPP